MRSMSLLIAVATLAGCSTAPQYAADHARSEAKLQKELAGRVAGRPVDCLPTFSSADMVRIDDDTVLFRDGPDRIYRNELRGSCSGLGEQGYALVTNSFGGGGRICRGDIARVVDMSTRMNVGSCVIGEFVPYTRPRA